MNAVNLLPSDLRRGTGAPSRSGVAVYVALGALAVAVVLVAALTIVKGSVSDREAQLAVAEAEAVQAEQRAASIAHYKDLAAQTGSRVTGVKAVAAGRVNWQKTFTQISQTIGTKVAFSTLSAGSAGSAGTAGASSASGSAAGSTGGPSVEIAGCAENHPAVARLMVRLRAMNDVDGVKLSSSAKPRGTDGAAPAGDGGDCSAGGKLPAKFTLAVTLKQSGTATATTADAAATTPSTATSGESK